MSPPIRCHLFPKIEPNQIEPEDGIDTIESSTIDERQDLHQLSFEKGVEVTKFFLSFLSQPGSVEDEALDRSANATTGNYIPTVVDAQYPADTDVLTLPSNNSTLRVVSPSPTREMSALSGITLVTAQSTGLESDQVVSELHPDRFRGGYQSTSITDRNGYKSTSTPDSTSKVVVFSSTDLEPDPHQHPRVTTSILHTSDSALRSSSSNDGNDRADDVIVCSDELAPDPITPLFI